MLLCRVAGNYYRGVVGAWEGLLQQLWCERSPQPGNIPVKFPHENQADAL